MHLNIYGRGYYFFSSTFIFIPYYITGYFPYSWQCRIQYLASFSTSLKIRVIGINWQFHPENLPYISQLLQFFLFSKEIILSSTNTEVSHSILTVVYRSCKPRHLHCRPFHIALLGYCQFILQLFNVSVNFQHFECRPVDAGLFSVHRAVHTEKIWKIWSASKDL